MTKNRVAAIQMVSGKDIAANLEQCRHWVSEAAGAGAAVVVLPENFALLDSYQSIELGQAESDAQGKVRSFLADLAASHGIWLVAGSLPCARRPDGSQIADRVRSVCWVVDAQGREVARYDKIHLFDVDVEDSHGQYRESNWFEPGTEVVTVDTPLGKLGLSICYDLRFPELYRRLVEQGADWVVVPSAFTYATGEAHWETLLRARAIENQVAVVAAGQGGWHSETRRTYGHSMIVDAWGRILAVRNEEGAGMVIADLDPEYQRGVRSRMPVLTHRTL